MSGQETPVLPVYTGLRVVEIADNPAGEYVGKLLADHGAEVVKIEPVGGCGGRAIGPYASGVEEPDNSLHFWNYNAGKKSVVLDGAAGRRRRDALIAAADVLITTGGPADLERAELELENLSAKHPTLIILSVSPFGLTGPWADYQTSDLVALATGGLLMSCGYDDHSIPPIRPGGNQGFMTAASYGHCAVLLAILERQQSGLGQLIDLSIHDSNAVSGELANPYWFYPKVLVHRQTARHAQPKPTQPSLYQCADGVWIYFAFVLSEQRTWLAVRDWLDSHDMAADLVEDAYLDLAHRQQNFHYIQNLIECFFLVQESETVYREGQRRGLPIAPLRAPEDLLTDEHLRQRQTLAPLDIGNGNRVLFPQNPIKFSTGRTETKRPPRLGEHTEEVLTRVE